MTRKLIAVSVLLLICAGTVGAKANSVGFEINTTFGSNGYGGVPWFWEGSSGLELTATVIYDFTDFAMFGGGVNVVWDTTALELVEYVPADLPHDAQQAASPIGELTAPGVYSGLGIGTFVWLAGMTSAGEIGTFHFNILGRPDQPGATPCGAVLCLFPNDSNPFVSLDGDVVTDELLGNGLTVVYPVPVPAALWFLLSGLGLFAGNRVRAAS